MPSLELAPPAAPHPAEPAAVEVPARADPQRAEHDALAARLAARESILVVRRASVSFFLALLLLGLTGKLAWDRWGGVLPGQPLHTPQHGPALHVWGLMLASIVAFAFSIRWFLRARKLLAGEAALFERFKKLRAALGFDA
jgi:hypothetical protein